MNRRGNKSIVMPDTSYSSRTLKKGKVFLVLNLGYGFKFETVWQIHGYHQ